MNIYSALGTQSLIPSAQDVDNSPSASEVAREQAEKEKVDFLQLLLTQLENQNPLDPMDTDEWTAQLTRYSILEQGIETNEKLSVTNDILGGSAASANLAYIGQSVEVATNMSPIQNGESTWSYVVNGSPSEVKLTISDNFGNQIDEVEGSIAAGVRSFSVNAADYDLSEGETLVLSVNAIDADGEPLDSKISSLITVDGVWTDNQNNYLTAGQISFRTNDVLKLIDTTNNQTTDAAQTVAAN
jgi:flagellar basal-body rod modification protein FlgD